MSVSGELSELLPGRSSMECSQDVSHIIRSAFHKQSLHDMDSELVNNILAAKGSQDKIQELYVETLETIRGEYSSAISNISQLEKHIMHAQTRVVSAKERKILAGHLSSDVMESKIKTSLRDSLNPELLQKNRLITPNDFFKRSDQPIMPPKPQSGPNYLKSLERPDGSQEEHRGVIIAWDDDLQLGIVSGYITVRCIAFT